MSDTSDRKDVPWHAIFRGVLPLETETTRFVLVSALDVLMTYVLLRYGTDPDARVRFVESNPIARWFLAHWGVKGMVYFKFGMVALVCVIAQVVATQKPRVATWLLNFATVVVAGVVIYSFTLFAKALWVHG